MPPFLIDTHSHIHLSTSENKRNDILARMKSENIWTITVGTNTRTSKEAVAFAEAHENIWATAGYHPEHLTSSYVDENEGEPGAYSIEEIRSVATSSKKIVAIGETGLDFFRIDDGITIDNAKRIQEQAFREHIKLAHELSLPVVIHCRNAFDDLARILSDEISNGKKIRAIVHCFSGSWEDAKPLLDLGVYLSFTGIITFPPKKSEDPKQSIHRVIEQMPVDRIMVETDSPWLAPVPYRGKQNEPTYVKYVAEKIAELRKIDITDFSKIVTTTSGQFFQIRV